MPAELRYRYCVAEILWIVARTIQTKYSNSKRFFHLVWVGVCVCRWYCPTNINIRSMCILFDSFVSQFDPLFLSRPLSHPLTVSSTQLFVLLKRLQCHPVRYFRLSANVYARVVYSTNGYWTCFNSNSLRIECSVRLFCSLCYLNWRMKALFV